MTERMPNIPSQLARLAWLLTVVHQTSGFPDKPFQLTFSPADIIRDVTTDIWLECAHDGKTAESNIRQVTSVKLVKKSHSVWETLAEAAWLNATLRTYTFDGSNPAQPLLRFKWKTADQNVFGVYRCEVAGFDKMEAKVTESTADVELQGWDVASFLLKLQAQHGQEIKALEENHTVEMQRLNTRLNTLAEEVRQVSANSVYLKQEIANTNANVTFHNSSTHKKLDKINDGIATLNATVETMHCNYSIVRESVKESKNNLSSINKQLEQIRERFQRLDSNLTARLAHLSVRDVKEAASDSKVHSLEKTLDSVVQLVEVLSEHVTVLSQTVTSSEFSPDEQLAAVRESFLSLGGNITIAEDENSPLLDTEE
ncbi:hypothetical protein ElyMa_005626100 [Elysia marginata]|uniref:Uncharacterized protein n=1 Tax=Elysia marginata TaxID=1093978 RepID=A0AAV4FA86_9GAST|nr:hypothetical protein ElyMa_005626100 [Elysia marginata]